MGRTGVKSSKLSYIYFMPSEKAHVVALYFYFLLNLRLRASFKTPGIAMSGMACMCCQL